MDVFSPGQMLDYGFKVVRKIGEGGFGIVYLVEHVATDSYFALKTYKGDYFTDPDAFHLFEREVSIWINLDKHLNIVRAKAIFQQNGRLCLIMEYIPPNPYRINSLSGLLKNGKFVLVNKKIEIRDIINCSIQLCHGLQSAYSKGVRCHLDLKPENILITQNGIVKITDFGITGVKVPPTSEDTRDITFFETDQGVKGGSLAFMPPEQFDPSVQCDQRSDIFALGINMYLMITGGVHPYIKSYMVNKIKSSTPTIAEFETVFSRFIYRPVHPILDPIIKKCLNLDPALRYQNIDDLLRDLKEIYLLIFGIDFPAPSPHEMEMGDLYNKGSSYFALEKYSVALKFLDDALGIDQNDASLWSTKGACLDGLDRRDEAIECHKKAIEIDPNISFIWSNLANSYFQKNMFEAALEKCEVAIRLDPLNIDAHCTKAKTLTKFHQSDEGIIYIEPYYDKDPENIELLEAMGYCLFNTQRYDRALGYYQQLTDAHPNLGFWYNLSGCLFNTGNIPKALFCIDHVLEDPGSLRPRALALKGAIFTKLHRYGDAQTLLNEAYELNPSDFDTNYWKGVCHLEQGHYRDSVPFFNKIISLRRNWQDGYWKLAVALCRMSDHLGAVDNFCKAISIDRDNPYSWYNLGTFLHKIGYLLQAKEALERSIVLKSDFPDSLNNLGLVLSDLNQRDEAIRCYNRALDISKNDPRYNFNIAEEYFHSDEVEEAIVHYRKAIALDQSHFKSWAKIGISYYWLKEYKKALLNLNLALAINKYHSLAWSYKGLVLREQSRFEEAEICFNNAIFVDIGEEPRL